MSQLEQLADVLGMFQRLDIEHKKAVLETMRYASGQKCIPEGMRPIMIDGQFWLVDKDILARMKAEGREVWEVPLPEPVTEPAT